MFKITAKKESFLLSSAALLLAVTLAGCRGQPTDKPAIMLQQNMAEQTSYEPQSKNDFFKDGKATRAKITGTIAQGKECTDSRYCHGLEPESTSAKEVFVNSYPLPVTKELVARGRERFNIHCSGCHGYAGDADGLVTQAAGGSIRPPSLHDADRLQMPLGEIYKAVTYGVNNMNMPGFSHALDVKDRWAVVSYVDALRKSRQASAAQIPDTVKEKNGWNK